MFWTILFGILVAYFLIKVIFPAISDWIDEAPVRKATRMAEKHLMKAEEAQKVIAGVRNNSLSDEEWEKFLSKHEQIFDEFMQKVNKVEVTAFSKSADDMEKLKQDILEGRLAFMPSDDMLKAGGFNPFYEYGNLIADFLNKLATEEGLSDMKIRNDERENREAWIFRVSKKKNGTFWVHVHTSLSDIAMVTHEARLKASKERLSGLAENKK